MKQLFILSLSLLTAVSAFAQTKTVTNSDLEKFRQQRVESERKLRTDYAKMGLPSPAEIERRTRQSRAEFEQYSDQLRQRRVQSQNDLVTQANNLSIQIASIDAQINYLRRQNTNYSNQNYVYSYGYAPYGYPRNRSVLPQIARLPQNARTVQEYAAMYPSSQSIYNQSTGNVRIGGNNRGYNNNRGYYRGGYIAPVIIGGSYQSNNINPQLIYLEQQRAALLAQWQNLANQARQAGIRID
jgi:predicted RND superfamily exporter protein